ncbi:hypothetical protein ES332_D03G166500v1 [Gossypium tomentosum]|uniref:Proteasome alpha-type subunits domain-containing protein n=1 Tax=Gossypium tomentosum TaxID=34277 RepID=A0A5D2LPU3_GOSTO|nr:hypothetical protein ES332_D03G166500v1 [Gossypium tomentosum]
MFGWGNRNAFPPIPWAHHQINVWLGLILLHPCSLLCLLLILAVIAILSLKRGIEIPRQFPILFSFFYPHPLSAFPNFFPSRFLLLLLVRPSGKLVQIEHALTAVGSGQTYLGIKAANGVVIATEKKLPSILVDETSVQKIQCLTPNIGVVYSSMGPNFRVLVRKSRKQAEQYHRLYKWFKAFWCISTGC